MKIMNVVVVLNCVDVKKKTTFDYDGDEPVICAIRLRRKRL